jgi:hypothetical protein
LTGAQLAGEFLPFSVKMTPFFGSMVSVLLVFVLNSEAGANKVSGLYTKTMVRSLHRFLSHK